MKKIISFGKISYQKRKVNEVTIELELKEDEESRYCFSCRGDVWNMRHTDTVVSGQCLNYLLPYFTDNEKFLQIYRLWKNYHLNDMHAGTPAQEKIIKESGKYMSYELRCGLLKNHNLYIDNGYEYSSGWLYEPIPQEDLDLIKSLMKEGEN